MEKLKNVFDSDDEFNSLKGSILEGVKKFSQYRNGNVTYGEIMYVMECILDEMRDTSEKEVKKLRIKGVGKPISFSVLMGISGLNPKASPCMEMGQIAPSLNFDICPFIF